MITVYFLICLKRGESVVSCINGVLVSISNVSVTSGKISHACQADFFPFPKKQEVVSHPVNAWNTGRKVDLGLPRIAQI